MVVLACIKRTITTPLYPATLTSQLEIKTADFHTTMFTQYNQQY